MKTLSLAIMALCVAFDTSPCRAHYLWIEPQGATEARIYFGEYQEGLVEKSGGRLDERAGLAGWTQTAAQAADLGPFEKKTDHFLATLDQRADWILVHDTAGAVRDWRAHGIGVVKPMFYARAPLQDRLSPTAPVLTADIVPVSGSPDELQVFFKQSPLPTAKVLVYAPNQWTQERRTDSSGKVKILTPWPGRYVIDVIHQEPAVGEFNSVSYQAIRHRVTFSFVRSETHSP